MIDGVPGRGGGTVGFQTILGVGGGCSDLVVAPIMGHFVPDVNLSEPLIRQFDRLGIITVCSRGFGLKKIAPPLTPRGEGAKFGNRQ